jgi:hypothetical protein
MGRLTNEYGMPVFDDATTEDHVTMASTDTPLYNPATGEAYGVPDRPLIDPETGRLAVWRKVPPCVGHALEADNDNESEADVLSNLLEQVRAKEMPPTAGDLARKAADLVSGDRDRQHGEKVDNFSRIASLWDAYLHTRRTSGPLTAVDVGHMMVLMKVARTQSGALNMDDYVDMAGYAACAGEIAGSRPRAAA